MKFSELIRDGKLVSVLEQNGFTDASPVQEQAFPYLDKNQSALIKAPTGSGKTLAYIVPLLLHLDVENKHTQALIVLPTSILVKQVEATLNLFKNTYKTFSEEALTNENKAKKTDAQILIATPDVFLAAYPNLNLKYASRLVIDEGDMILFGGFEEQLNEILSLNLSWSKVLFSASVDEHLNRLVRRYIGAERTIDLSSGKINTEYIHHYLVDIRHAEKSVALVRFLNAKKPYKTIVFVSKKEDIPPLNEALKKASIPHAVIYGELPKREQKRAYRLFEEGEVHLLLASDIAARGVDIKDVSDVISVDLPYDILYYFHRAGRAGRFYKEGNSYVFYNNDDTKKARELMNRGVKFTFLSLKGESVKEERTLSSIDKMPKKNNEVLEKLIKQKLRPLRSNEVRPNYKKKRRKMIAFVKSRHKDDVIRRNIYRRNQEEGTHYSFVRKSNPYTSNKKKNRSK